MLAPRASGIMLAGAPSARRSPRRRCGVPAARPCWSPGASPRTPCLPRCYLARPPARPSGAPAREAMKEEAMKEAERRMPEPVISVRGEASLEVEPEIAVVWVSVAARDANRHRAIELLAGRTGRASDTIKGFGEAIEKLESQPVVVQ